VKKIESKNGKNMDLVVKKADKLKHDGILILKFAGLN
jgi:hypothetical protein